jgi:hypothetical protein
VFQLLPAKAFRVIRKVYVVFFLFEHHRLHFPLDSRGKAEFVLNGHASDTLRSYHSAILTFGENVVEKVDSAEIRCLLKQADLEHNDCYRDQMAGMLLEYVSLILIIQLCQNKLDTSTIRWKTYYVRINYLILHNLMRFDKWLT